MIARYKNGNVFVSIDTKTGTKIRQTFDDDFSPAFAESLDICISERCDNGCEFCYAGCTPNGKFGDFNYEFLKHMHPYTEVSINLQFPLGKGTEQFLYDMEVQKVIVNATVNQKHFMDNYDYIKCAIDAGLIYGLGVSLIYPDDDFLNKIATIPNAVIHVISGIFSDDVYQIIKNKNIKLLILGYKNKGRGIQFYKKIPDVVNNNIEWLRNKLNDMQNEFSVLCFDNLAIEQLNVGQLLTQEAWETFYQGDEASHSFYINICDGTYSPSSVDTLSYPIGNLSIDEMFQNIRGKSQLVNKKRKD